MTALFIDCNACVAAPASCSDCVISSLLGSKEVLLEDEEQRALAVLADAGLTAPLRMDCCAEPKLKAV